ncbi:MAG: LCP family protein [Bacillota bacterium]
MTEHNGREKQTEEKQKRKKKRGQSNAILIFGTIILVAFLLAAGMWLKATWGEAYEVVLPGLRGSSASETDRENELESLPDIMNILILGLDSRDKAMRADTIMLLTLNHRNNEINIISIPRDMRVEIPGRGEDKINHAYAYGGVALTRDVVENFLGVKMDYYMTTEFSGFKNIVDILGGIELEVESKMRYYASDVTIELNPGLQRLDGDKALQYVRFRSDGEGDLGRVQRQQKFLKVLLEEMIAFRNVLKFHRLLPELARNIKTDLELSQAILLVNKLKNVDITEINTFTLPGRAGSVQGVSYILPIEEEILQLVERYVKGNDVKQS